MSVIIKKFTYNETYSLLKIFNSARVGGFFYKSSKISLDEHINFLVNNFENKKSLIYLAYLNYNSPAIGYAKFDKIQNSEVYEISIAVLPKFYGKGFGTIMMNKAIQVFKRQKFKKIIAVVKKNNIRSLKSFKKNNFKMYRGKKFLKKTIYPFNNSKEYYMYYNK